MAGGSSGDSIMMTNLIPTYVPNMVGWAALYLEQSATLSAGNNFTSYTGSTYAIQNANEIAGIAALVSRGTNGSLIEAHGETYLRKLFAGGYIGTNPYLDDAFQKLIDEQIQLFDEDVLPAIEDDHAFSFGGSEYNVDEAKASEKLMTAINAIIEKIYFDDYQNERKIQDAGMNHAAIYGQRGIRDAEIRRSAAVYAREYLQGSYKDNWAKWNEDQIIPIRNLDIIGNALKTVIGTTRTAATQYYKPPAIAEMAGIAMTGLSLYGMSKDITKKSIPSPRPTMSVIPDFLTIPKTQKDFFWSQEQVAQQLQIEAPVASETPMIDDSRNI
jgi:hypothetical protein